MQHDSCVGKGFREGGSCSRRGPDLEVVNKGERCAGKATDHIPGGGNR